jgi:hypothetical protein
MRALLILLFVLVEINAFSQKANLSSYKCLIGDQIAWNIQMKIDSKETKVEYIACKKLIPCQRKDPKNAKASKEIELEILSPYSISIEQIDGKFFWNANYQLMAWDTGLITLPKQVIVVAGKQFEIATTSLEVNNIALSANKEIYDIDEQFSSLSRANETEKSFIEKFWWAIILAILVISFLIFWWFRKRNENELSPRISSTLLQRTLKELDDIEKQQLWRSDIKAHFTEVSDVFRSFNTELFSIDFSKLTTQQAIGMLQQLKTPSHCLEPAQRILDHSDLVKFAQSAPNELLIQQQIQEVKKVVTLYFESKIK